MTCYVYESLGMKLGTDFCMMILGDDNLTAAKYHPPKELIQRKFKELGFSIKFSVSENPEDADYCSNWFSPIEPIEYKGTILRYVAAPTLKALKAAWSVADIPKGEQFASMHARSVALSLQGADMTPILSNLMNNLLHYSDKQLTGKAARAFERAYRPKYHWAPATLPVKAASHQRTALARRYKVPETLVQRLCMAFDEAPKFSLLDGDDARAMSQAIINVELT